MKCILRGSRALSTAETHIINNFLNRFFARFAKCYAEANDFQLAADVLSATVSLHREFSHLNIPILELLSLYFLLNSNKNNRGNVRSIYSHNDRLLIWQVHWYSGETLDANGNSWLPIRLSGMIFSSFKSFSIYYVKTKSVNASFGLTINFVSINCNAIDHKSEYSELTWPVEFLLSD